MEQIRSKGDPDYLHALRHSGAHLLAQAVMRHYPNAKLTVGPATEEGFFYDIDLQGKTLSPQDLEAIEKEMAKIVREDFEIKYSEMPRHEASDFLLRMGQTYKAELLNSIPEDEPITFYTQGEFVDLCEGPHVRRTGELKYFKLLSAAGAYWKGDQRNPMLQRIYGTAFETKEELTAHLKMLEEAKKRDHRELGKKIDLFSFNELSPGSPFFHPKGTIVVNEMTDYIRELYREFGYQEVLTPQIYDVKLYHTSGHYETFRKNMYFIEEGEMSMKPMNCPGHCVYYKGKLFSYKELPLRVAEFTRLHRNEPSGTLHGLDRVRAFHQDDAHIFCTEDQIESETNSFFEFLDLVYKTFGFSEYRVKLATRPEARIGDESLWDRAEKELEQILKSRNVPYEILEGEGAFYGPKYEIHLKDAIGRSWQLATLQLDFALPMRFELEYVGSDGKRHRPVMLHRAVYGSLERFLGVYLEHCEGYLPLWLAPIQIYLVPVRESHHEFARNIQQRLREFGLRVYVDDKEGNMGGKVREATNLRVPYIGVIGDKEIEKNAVALKSPKWGDFGTVLLDQLELTLRSENKTRATVTRFQKSS